MYKYNSVNDEKISLHDCRANRIEFKDGVLSFFFPEGFRLISSHPQNESENTVLTGPSQVDFEIIDGEIEDNDFYILKQTATSPTTYLKTEIEAEQFINAVNSGKYEVEFLYPYVGYQSVLFQCWVWFNEEPYHHECEIILHSENTTYRWDEIRYDHYW